jgi:hypothetical protein
VFEQARAAGLFRMTWSEAEYTPADGPAEFTVGANGRLLPITSAWSDTVDDAHPIVALYTRNPQMEAAAVEWARLQPGFQSTKEAA